MKICQLQGECDITLVYGICVHISGKWPQLRHHITTHGIEYNSASTTKRQVLSPPTAGAATISFLTNQTSLTPNCDSLDPISHQSDAPNSEKIKLALLFGISNTQLRAEQSYIGRL